MRTNIIPQILFCSFLLLAPGILSAADTPEAAYQMFHDAMLNGDMDTMLQLSPASIKTEIADYSPEQKQQMLAMMGKLLPKTYSVLSLEPGADANTATLYTRGMGAALLSEQQELQYGTIALVKEDGDWKVGKSSWNNQAPKTLPKSSAPTVTAASTPPPVPAAPAAPSPAPPAAAATPVAAVPAAPAQPKPPEKKKPVCIIKQVMSNAEIDACRQASAEP